MCQQGNHHWVIDPPTSPVSKGICIKCKETKMFQNRYFDGSDYLMEYHQITPRERQAIIEGRKSGILFV